MALKSYILPVCDMCGEPWLPQKGPLRDDPRGEDARRRAAGENPLRCAKCKSTSWDKNFTGDRRKTKNRLGDGKECIDCGQGPCDMNCGPALPAANAPLSPAPSMPVRCPHGLSRKSCPSCGKESA